MAALLSLSRSVNQHLMSVVAATEKVNDIVVAEPPQTHMHRPL